MPRCGGCNKLAAFLERAVVAPATRRRCQPCYRAGRFWLACEECGNTGACTKHDGEWLCVSCGRYCELRAGKSIWRSGYETNESRLALYDEHLSQDLTRLIDFWVSPESSEPCLLTLARLIFWRRWSTLVGLVRGAGATSWSNGKKAVSTSALVAHFAALRTNGEWPGGREAVLVSGVKPQHVTALKRALREEHGWPLAQCARLVALQLPLSERFPGAKRGFSLKGFLSQPRAADCPLIQRCKKAMTAAWITYGTPRALDAAGVSDDAFRRMLLAE